MDDTIVVTSAPKIATPNMDVASPPSVTMNITETVKQAADGVGENAAGIDWMKIGKLKYWPRHRSLTTLILPAYCFKTRSRLLPP